MDRENLKLSKLQYFDYYCNIVDTVDQKYQNNINSWLRCFWGVPANTNSIVAVLFMNKPPSTFLGGGIYLSSSNASHNMPASRIYCSQIVVVEPQKAINLVKPKWKSCF